MKSAFFLLFLAVFSRPIVAEISYTVTGTKDGKPIDSSDIEFIPYESTRTAGLGGAPDSGFIPKTPPTREKSTSLATKKKRFKDILYSEGWYGPSFTTPTTKPITNVNAYIQVLTPAFRPNVTGPQYIAEWVGIDGNT
jgi:hypothetical protein